MRAEVLTPTAEQTAAAQMFLGKLDSVESVPDALRPYLSTLINAAARSCQVIVASAADELTPAEAAQLLDMSRPTISRLLAEGRIPSRKVGNRHRIALSDIIEYQNYLETSRDRFLDKMVAFEEEMADAESKPA